MNRTTTMALAVTHVLMGAATESATTPAAVSSYMAGTTSAARAGVLSEFDHIICIDQSGSMLSPYKTGSETSRWDYAHETILGLAMEACKLDDDGIDLIFFHGGVAEVFTKCSAAKVTELFKTRTPSGGTPLNAALVEAFKLANASAKNAFITVLTDGEPQDKESPAKTIVAQANSQTKDEECTVLFIQVGDDSAATAYLKNLDDGLQAQGAKFDIVDVKTVDQVAGYATVADMIVDAIND